jgi:predicted AAA+ superfamily ATPase
MDNAEMVKNNAGEIVERLIRDLSTQDGVDIRFAFEDDEQWAVVTLHLYEEDREIAIQLHSEDRFFLYFGYYDDQDEFFEIVHPLTEEEKMIIPKTMKKLLHKVLADEQGMRLPGHLLSR